MAEIPIQRKESRSWLPLLLVGLLILAVLGFCFLRPHPATAVAAGADSTSAAPAAAVAAPAAAAAPASPTAVNQYMHFVQQRDTSKETEAQHAYTAQGVRLLATALDEVAVQHSGPTAGQSGGSAVIAVYADSMRRSIIRLQHSSPHDVHAEDARAAFNAAVSAMSVIGKAEGRAYDVTPMRAITKQLVSTTPLMPQLPIVERFFAAAGQALQALNIPGANAASAAAGSGPGTNGTGAAGSGQ